VTIEGQLVKLNHHKSALETVQATIVDLTNAQTQGKDVVAAINREGGQCPTITWASENVAAVAVLLDALHAPSIDGVDKVYLQLKDILGFTTTQ
jgi:hypothetical protein